MKAHAPTILLSGNSLVDPFHCCETTYIGRVNRSENFGGDNYANERGVDVLFVYIELTAIMTSHIQACGRQTACLVIQRRPLNTDTLFYLSCNFEDVDQGSQPLNSRNDWID